MKLTLGVNKKESEMVLGFIAWGLGIGNGFYRKKGEWNKLYKEERKKDVFHF